MTRLTALLLLTLACIGSGAGASGTVDWTAVHSLTVRGIDQLYNMDIDGALATFERVTAMAPDDPRGHFFRSMVYFWRYNLQRDEASHERFFALADTVIDVCEQVLDNDETNASAHFFLGGIYGYRGMAYQTAGSLLKAVYDGRKGYKNMEEASRLDPGLHDAQMGLGLFRYLVAKTPRSFSWVFRILGFNGDIEGGLASLRLAAEQGIYARTEATFFLSQFLFNEHRYDEAFHFMEELTRKYPDNTLFLLTEANWFRRLQRFDEALQVSRRAVEINKRVNLKYGEEFAYSTLAAVQYAMNDFQGARDNFAAYMNSVASRDLVTNWILYRYGVAKEILGDRAGAVELYRMARPVDDKEKAFEATWFKNCRDRAERPMAPAEQGIIRGNNELALKHYEAAQQLFEQAASDAGNDPDQLAEALYGVQQSQDARGLNRESAATGNRIVRLSPVRENWIIPHALLKLGLTEKKLGAYEEARRAFEAVDNYDDYEHQSSVETQAENELDSLKNMK